MSVVLAGAVVCGGGPGTTYSSCRAAPMISDLASCKLCFAATVGSPRVVSPGPRGLVGDAGVGASYDGGADPDLGTDVGRGVEGRPFTLPVGVGVSCVGWVVESWDRDARAAAPGGGPHDWLSGGSHGSIGGFSSWSYGRREA